MWPSVVARQVALGFLVAGCVAGPIESEEIGETESPVIGSEQNGAPVDLPMVVQVLANDQPRNYCTGVLISPMRVLTAAHCLGADSFWVRAPYAPFIQQERKGYRGAIVKPSRKYNEEIWKEDVGTINLDFPIFLLNYAALKDVGELGEGTLKAIAVGRTHQHRDAPLVKSKVLEVSDGAARGYTTGLMTRYYSSGGDSGGPLFLVDENTGKPTYTVIGVERQPEPPSEFFSRITPAVRRAVGMLSTTVWASRSEGPSLRFFALDVELGDLGARKGRAMTIVRRAQRTCSNAEATRGTAMGRSRRPDGSLFQDARMAPTLGYGGVNRSE